MKANSLLDLATSQTSDIVYVMAILAACCCCSIFFYFCIIVRRRKKASEPTVEVLTPYEKWMRAEEARAAGEAVPQFANQASTHNPLYSNSKDLAKFHKKAEEQQRQHEERRADKSWNSVRDSYFVEDRYSDVIRASGSKERYINKTHTLKVGDAISE